MSRGISGATRVAGVVGSPVRHSLSPLIQNAWLQAAGVDGVYVAFSLAQEGLKSLVGGFRGGAVRGLNVTLPFKEEALALSDVVSPRARAAGAANLLVFEPDGSVVADNTDGAGLLAAFAVQAPHFDVTAHPAVVLGAGGAARGAAAALLDKGAPEVRLVNRTRTRAEAIRSALGGSVRVFEWSDLSQALAGAGCVINATSLGLEDRQPLTIDFAGLQVGAVAMDMVYRPLRTAFLVSAAVRGLATVDGLAMLIGQAEPSFETLFGRPPPDLDVRALALAALEASG